MARRLTLPLLVALALGTKLAVLLALGDHPLLQPDAGLDTGAYARLAWRVASGDLLLGTEPYFVSPLYVYFLAAVLKVASSSLFPARLVQVLLGSIAAGLVVAAARRLFGERAATVAGVLYVLAGVVTFNEILVLQSALDPFLTALFLFLLAVGLTPRGNSSKGKKGREGGKGGHPWGIWVAAGVAGGLLSLNRPNALVAVAAVAVALALPPLATRSRRSRLSSLSEEGPLRTFRPAIVFAIGTGLAIAPVTLRNLAVSHEFVLISSHGGLNFFIGNNPEANGTYRAIPGITPSIEGQAEDTKRVAESEAGRSLSVREVSAHFARKAWRWVGANPGAAARLFVRKVWYVLSGDEVALNFSHPWYREKSLALRLLVVGPGLLVPLGGAGLALLLLGAGRLRPADAAPWAAFSPAYVLAVAAFFVATRYRLPLVPALAIAAGGAAAFAVEALREGCPGRLVPA
ncbi:MAG TPA: glycosyltransferase family 39 protein, partial [Thermoanaerobaculia bacterium]|nr:glycosyltransferase family 39 protein [Thermoanaerobaculia bacterium]